MNGKRNECGGLPAFQHAIGGEAGWRELGAEDLIGNAHLRVAEEKVVPPGRDRAVSWTVVHRKMAVVVVPVTVEGRLVLIRQHRVPVRASLWEFPAGQVDDHSPPLEQALQRTALREMREECGYRLADGAELLYLGHFLSSPGFTDEHAHIFLADTVEEDENGHDHDDDESIIEVRSFTLDELASLVASGTLRDANSLCVYARLHATGIAEDIERACRNRQQRPAARHPA